MHANCYLMLSSAARSDPSRLVHLGAGDGETYGGQEGKHPHTFSSLADAGIYRFFLKAGTFLADSSPRYSL
jgi:hypothetical protein